MDESGKSQWNITVKVLQEVFFWRLGKVTEIDQIHRNSVAMLANLSRDESDVHRYGLAIQKFAKRLQDYLQDHYAWHGMMRA